ncbi:helix-turn-helix domain-containing protein [Chryseobacterium foetidum]|uniref:helix-turn-helix domain-containing protein n=1 Tax=Chryseobacterium foetidum TaxID=2951057 RepID=UPI0021C676F6|nr:helix-turn-helix domain-containing protein [Chryseobacterium foetidum]
MSGRTVLTFFLSIIGTILLSQMKVSPSYAELRKKYENLEKDDRAALPYVKTFIQKAKNENNFEKLSLGYKDAVFFNKDAQVKLFYADSTIAAAFKSKKNELISDAFLGKGIIYYFNFRKFQLASDEYVKAHKYAVKTNDEYLQKKIIYHLGVVKSYLGYYSKALQLFNQSIEFNENKAENETNANLRFNYCRGYLNSLHQMVICHRNLNQNTKADSLLDVGLSATKNKSEFILERAYFLKCAGIIYYKNNQYSDALYYLKKALPVIEQKNDFTWAAVIHFYLGNIYLRHGDDRKGVMEFKKVDSIYNRHQFLLPEASESYRSLIAYYKKRQDEKEQLYYTDQLLRVNEGIRKDFSYLAEKIYEDFEIAGLVKEKYQLEKSINIQKVSIVLVCILSLGLILFLIRKYRQREQNLKQKYAELILRLQTVQKPEEALPQPQAPVRNKVELPGELVERLKKKIQHFEDHHQFLEAGLTVAKLAGRFRTNPTYLSEFIHDCKGVHFSIYLMNLRINYITHKLNSDPDYLKFTVKALSEMCGIASRNNFATHFKSVNGIAVSDFIKMKSKDNRGDL